LKERKTDKIQKVEVSLGNIEELLWLTEIDKTQLDQKTLTFISEGKINFAKVIYDEYLQQDYESFIYKFGSETSFPAFLLVMDELTNDMYWKLLGQVLNDDVYFFDYKEIILKLLENHNKDTSLRYLMMTDQEYEKYKALDGKFIYRGAHIEMKNGLSWTLDIQQADYFAKRHYGDCVVLKGKLKSHNQAYAYKKREEEVLVNPENLSDISIIEEFYNEEPSTNSNKHSETQKIKKYVLNKWKNHPLFNN
jgi:hypothetical protein